VKKNTFEARRKLDLNIFITPMEQIRSSKFYQYLKVLNEMVEGMFDSSLHLYSTYSLSFFFHQKYCWWDYRTVLVRTNRIRVLRLLLKAFFVASVTIRFLPLESDMFLGPPVCFKREKICSISVFPALLIVLKSIQPFKLVSFYVISFLL
jgi:hypothetical protein